MRLELYRLSSQSDSTIGALYIRRPYVGLWFLCFTLEDEYRKVKIPGETRIPAGEYEIKLRKYGGFHERYSRKYGAMHKGMLWLQNVPGFEYILIHLGNTTKHTKGCLLLGDTAVQNVTKQAFIGASGDAYKRVYPPIAQALEKGERVWIKIIDFDK